MGSTGRHNEERWLQGKDSNLRPSGYEPDELPLLHPASEISRPHRAVRQGVLLGDADGDGEGEARGICSTKPAPISGLPVNGSTMITTTR